MFKRIAGAIGLVWGTVWFVDGDVWIANMVTIAAVVAGVVICGVAAMLVGSEYLQDMLGGKIVEVQPGLEEEED